MAMNESKQYQQYQVVNQWLAPNSEVGVWCVMMMETPQTKQSSRKAKQKGRVMKEKNLLTNVTKVHHSAINTLDGFWASQAAESLRFQVNILVWRWE